MAKVYTEATFICVGCGGEFPRTAPNNRRCPECRKLEQRRANSRWVQANTASRRAYYAANAEKIQAQRKVIRQADPERHARYQKRYQEKHRLEVSLRRKCRQFGMAMDELLAMFHTQGEQCPICLQPLTLNAFDVDHCHDTGVVRGLLHDICNRGIGMLRDDPDRCERAAAYLRERLAT